MSKPPVIRAEFVGYHQIKTRKAFQIVLEVPEEHTRMVFDTLGVPMSGSSLPVAVARLVAGAKMEQPKPEEPPPEKDKTPRRFDSLPLPQQAALLCQDEAFHVYLRNWYTARVGSEDEAAHWLRAALRIASRSELSPGTEAAERFFKIRDGFTLWKQGYEG